MREKFNPVTHLKSLPEKLQAELRINSAIETKVLNILEEGGGTLNLSEILVGLYTVYNDVYTRLYITAITYRLAKKKMIEPTGKKGEYKLLLSCR